MVKIAGKPVHISNPADAIKHGIGFVTEDRKRFGLVLDQTILNNMTLAGLRRISGRFITSVDAESAAGERAMKDLRVKANSVFTIAGTLSGGNQQKVVLAKWLLTNPRVLFLRRADARHRRRRETGNLCPDQRAGEDWTRYRAGFIRIARSARALRSRHRFA